MSKPEDFPSEVPAANKLPQAANTHMQDVSGVVYPSDVSSGMPAELTATGLPRSRYYERMEDRRLRNLKIKTVAALTGGIACSAFLVANMPVFNGPTTEHTQYSTEIATPDPDTDEQLGDKSLPTRRYTDVAVHYVSFNGGLPFAGDRQRVAADVQSGLRALDNAHENTLGIADLPTMVSPGTYDLTESSVAVEEICEPGAQPVTTSTRILNALNEQVPLKDETLDVVVFDVDESKDCGDIPIGQAVSGDVVIYQGSKLTETVAAHEINHNEGHAHDNRYEVSRKGNVVAIDASPYYVDRGNTQTIAGYSAYAETLTDKDPLIGYELQRNGVIKENQIATVEAGQAKDIQIEALTNRHADTRLVELPLAAGTLSSSDKFMLELSTDNGMYTLKMYGAGVTASEQGDELGATYLVPLSDDGRQSGLGTAQLNQPVTVELATGEQITLTLKRLTGADSNTRATVHVGRA